MIYNPESNLKRAFVLDDVDIDPDGYILGDKNMSITFDKKTMNITEGNFGQVIILIILVETLQLYFMDQLILP
ncbi:hypothetical protein B0P06_000177 [Clostridium saccharoperbutylacetonicum]|uniref:hypothetical protein n=1 Tax=Clostridium saccharoperbutylacetonicum TaxID=36745 RepID=UPI001FA7B7D8|nr:hypothetical protein [Clostridium saccharoperbutylacetonicum]NSB40406.1 hypothetical protein [Clostridium saccharoperbutylacetonicum]